MGILSRISPEAIKRNQNYIYLGKRGPMVDIEGGKVEDIELIPYEPSIDPINLRRLGRNEIIQYQAKRGKRGILKGLIHHLAEYCRGRNFDKVSPTSMRGYVQRKRWELMEKQNG